MEQRKTTLMIAELEDRIVRKFDDEPPIPLKKDDIVLGICQEMMDWLGYTEFKKQTSDIQADIVSIILQQKKSDWKYMPVAIDEPLFDDDE